MKLQQQVQPWTTETGGNVGKNETVIEDQPVQELPWFATSYRRPPVGMEVEYGPKKLAWSDISGVWFFKDPKGYKAPLEFIPARGRFRNKTELANSGYLKEGVTDEDTRLG